MGTIRRNLYCILSGQSLLFAQRTAWMGKCLLRFSHLIQITGDLLFTCTTHCPVEKKVGDEISPSHPRSFPANACSGFPILLARDARALLLPGRCPIYHLCILLPSLLFCSSYHAIMLTFELCTILPSNINRQSCLCSVRCPGYYCYHYG